MRVTARVTEMVILGITESIRSTVVSDGSDMNLRAWKDGSQFISSGK